MELAPSSSRIFGLTRPAPYTHMQAKTVFNMAVLPSIPGNLFHAVAASGIYGSPRRVRNN